MRRPLLNEFSWSKSRHEKLTDCLRAYYLHHYRSWGGWEPDAAPEARALWVLKRLSNRFAWAGSVVHESIKDALLALRAGRAPDAGQVEAAARRQMQEDFRLSRAKAYRTQRLRKSFAGLVEHEYDEPVSAQAWKDNFETVRQALGWFFSSRWPALARALAPAAWLEVDAGFDTSHFTLEGVKVFAIPDLVYLDADGAPVVVDWKTGRAREGYDEQVLGYALYVASRYGHPVERVRAHLVYLNEGLEQQVQVDAQAVSAFRAHFGRSVGRMRALLADPATNTPRPEDAFALTDDLSVCARCVFRRSCGREGASAQGAGAAQVA